jgi:DNA mismatch repair protein MutL
MIDTPPDAIDVNVHPNKTQIKFLDNDIIYSLLVTAIKSSIKVESHSSSVPPSHFISTQNRDISHFSLINLTPVSPIQDSTSNNEFIFINNSFVLHQKESLHFLINLKKLTDNVIINNINKCLINDENISPLLVSEPFSIKNITIDKSFDQLKKLGFEFDRLSSDTIILRTIPKDLPRALLQYSVTLLIDFFTNITTPYDQAKFENLQSKCTNCKITFNLILVQVLIKQSELDYKNIMIQLSDEKLWQLFK